MQENYKLYHIGYKNNQIIIYHTLLGIIVYCFNYSTKVVKNSILPKFLGVILQK